MTETDPLQQVERDDDEASEIPLNVVFDALADRHRRRVLRCLRDDDPPVPVESIVQSLRADGVDDDERTLRARLHHRDLPRLDDHGVISYDPSANSVVGCDRLDAVQPYLDTALRMER